MTPTEFAQSLAEARQIVNSFRIAKPGVPLAFRNNAARKAHQQVKEAAAWLRNAKEDANCGTDSESASMFDAKSASAKLTGIRRSLRAAQEVE